MPDPFQTAGIGFHYDAPGARPPQAILLALPPKLDQDVWTFDDLIDVMHETFDLAKLRGVRPSDLGERPRRVAAGQLSAARRTPTTCRACRCSR